MSGRIVLVRHGQTPWSESGRHTGSTDITLTAEGEQQAKTLARPLAGYDIALTLSSPLHRAWLTAELAGLTPTAEPALMERRYGAAEGLTTAQLRQLTGQPHWDVWDADLATLHTITSPPGAVVDGPESLQQVVDRVRPVLDRCAEVVAGGRDCVLVSHSHLLRILAATWLALPPITGRHLVLDAAHLGLLGYERETPALLGWNLPPG
ncbi:MAG: histidine phosphatase family protein [Candidatus Nanopelagicales bacterium]